MENPLKMFAPNTAESDAAARAQGEANFETMREKLYGPMSVERREIFIPKIEAILDNPDASIMDIYLLSKDLMAALLKEQPNLDYEATDGTYR